MANEHQAAFLHSETALHVNGKHSDMAIECEGRTFRLHRAIVCPQSELLAKEIDSNMQEANGLIKHVHFRIDVLKRVISYLYTQDYDVVLPESQTATNTAEYNDSSEQPNLASPMTFEELGATTETTALESHDNRQDVDIKEYEFDVNAHLLAHVEVHAAANYFCIPTLRVKAVEKFRLVLLNHEWQQSGFVEVLRSVYHLPRVEDQGLRAAIQKTSFDSLTALMDNEDFQKTMDDSCDLGEFCMDLLRLLRVESKDSKELAKASQKTLERKIADLERSLEATGREKDFFKDLHAATDSDLDTVLNTLSGLDKCRHCDVNLKVSIQRRGRHGNGQWMARCGCCHTRDP